MSKETLERILAEIEDMQRDLNKVINEAGNLTNDEVITASKMLDALLNEYYKLLKRINSQ